MYRFVSTSVVVTFTLSSHRKHALNNTALVPSVELIVWVVASDPSGPAALRTVRRSQHRLVIEVRDGRERLHLHRLVGVPEVGVPSIVKGAQLWEATGCWRRNIAAFAIFLIEFNWKTFILYPATGKHNVKRWNATWMEALCRCLKREIRTWVWLYCIIMSTDYSWLWITECRQRALMSHTI